MYATMPMRVNRRVVQHGRTLYLPSQRHQINGDGLGGVLDTFKNLGKGVVSVLTAGMYDISKNRFYVPFSGGQARNLMQGFTNTTTLGLVNTDKFFNSQTMRTVGNVAAGVEAAAVAVVGGSALMNAAGASGATGATGVTGATGATSSVTSAVPSTTSLFSNPALQSANLSYMTGVTPSVAAPSTFGSFASAPITGAFQSVPTVANSFGTAVASTPSLLSQIGSGISNMFSKLPSALNTMNQITQAANPIVKALTSGSEQPQSVMAGDPTMGPMGGGFMPVSYGDPSQGLIPGGGVMLPAGYATGGGGGGGSMAIPMGGPEGGGEAQAAGSIFDHPAVPYVAVGAALLIAYYLYKK